MQNASNQLPTVAVLMATFNGEKFISRQLDSILTQINVKTLLFINDDCSTDSTVSIIETYQKRYSNIHLLKSNQKFGSAARNFFDIIVSVKTIEADYYAFSDQDDIWFEDKLTSAIEAISANSVGGFSSDAIAYWPEEKRTALIKKSCPQTEVDFWFSGPGPGCTMVFPFDSFRKFQRFLSDNWRDVNEIAYHDWLVYAYFRHNKLGWCISEKARIYYLQHASNEIGANNGWRAFLKRGKLTLSGWYEKEQKKIFSVVTGSEEELITLGFITKNFISLRRSKTSSLFLSIFLLARLLVSSLSFNR